MKSKTLTQGFISISIILFSICCWQKNIFCVSSKDSIVSQKPYVCEPSLKQGRVFVKNGWFYVNNERFFIKAVGYSPSRPGTMPSDMMDNEIFKRDLEKIKAAGFNTIRTWFELTPEQVKTADSYGLKIIQGVWIDFDSVLTKPKYIAKHAEVVTERINKIEACERNVIMFVIGNEPSHKVIQHVGVSTAQKRLKIFYQEVKKRNKGRVISFSDSPQLDYIDHSFWDAVCFNVYPYIPVSVSYVLGYQGYLEWLKNKFAKDKPLIVSEFGLSVSKKEEEPSSYDGYKKGGNTLEQQAQGTISLYKSIIGADCSGACVFEFIDEWWKHNEIPNDSKSHEDDDYEEWFGIVGVENIGKKIQEEPRPVYRELQRFQQALLISPRNMSTVRKIIPIEVFVNEDIQEVECRLDDGVWIKLDKQGSSWFIGKFDTSAVSDGQYKLQVRATDKLNNSYYSEAVVWVMNKGYVASNDIVKVKITVPSKDYKPWQTIEAKVKVTDRNNKPIENIEVYAGVYYTTNWMERRYKLVTDKNGEAVFKYATGYVGKFIIGSAVQYKSGIFEKRYGDLLDVNVTKSKAPVCETIGAK